MCWPRRLREAQVFRRYFWISLAVAALLLGALTATAAAGGSLASSPAAVALNVIATPTLDGVARHVVRSGETLWGIAQRYGVGVQQLVAANGIIDPARLSVGQSLRIPDRTQPAAAPPHPTPTAPSTSGSPVEEIIISSPGRGVTVTNPALVSGFASSPFEQTVIVAVLDGSGGRIGLGSGIIAGAYGERGRFSATVPFTVPVNSQAGRIQVFTESPRDGALEHLSSVSVVLEGAGLDALLGQLDAAVNAKDYAALESTMGPNFGLGIYRSERGQIKPAKMREQLQLSYLGPGAPRLDFSVDARTLLGSQVTLGPEVAHVVYSTGWGAKQNDDAFLLIGNVDDRARWIGMVYVPHALIDYRTNARPSTG
jgi:LysM repeat protein